MNLLGLEMLLAAARSGSPPPTWLLVAFPFFFVGMWLLTCTLLAWMAGFKALLERYPQMDEPLERVFRFASGSVRWVDFRNALYVGVGTGGLHLAPNWLFRSPFVRGVPCIPWSELRCIRAQGDGLLDWLGGSKFEVPALKLRFVLRGEPGRVIEHRLGLLPAERRLP
ncbi:hypothetical protein [Archangium lansingense]|uniref:Uncharacterized protein n=1 Tax=Archangium lansingense TaxID=2995310 RepID=A0ABT4A563_9BACT|nr:hypothetical protein [Archangium lansinium]MCY1076772.1 hypothetical protein [Archangium lansinium]